MTTRANSDFTFHLTVTRTTFLGVDCWLFFLFARCIYESVFLEATVASFIKLVADERAVVQCQDFTMSVLFAMGGVIDFLTLDLILLSTLLKYCQWTISLNVLLLKYLL